MHAVSVSLGHARTITPLGSVYRVCIGPTTSTASVVYVCVDLRGGPRWTRLSRFANRSLFIILKRDPIDLFPIPTSKLHVDVRDL